jgi:hypothetical protein
MIEPHPAQRRGNSPQDEVQPMRALLQVLVDEQAKLAETQEQMHGMLTRLIQSLEAAGKPAPNPAAPAKPTIATYEAMYGPIPPPQPAVLRPLPPVRRRHWLIRWLVRGEGDAETARR